MKTAKLISLLLITFCFSTFLYGNEKLSKGDHFAPINGIKIHYFVSGSGPVCLVPTPGWGPSMDYLRNSLTPFEKYFTVIYYDTRMSGQSTGPEDPSQYTSQIFMNDMDSLRVYLEQEKIWIMGHSSGGFQVLNYGINHCDNLNGIIAIDAMAGHDSLRGAEFRKIILKRKGQPYFEKGSKIILGEDTTNYNMPERMQLTMPFFFHDPKKMSDFLKLGEPKISVKANKYSNASKMGLEYLFPELNKITVPVLVVVGDDDYVCDKVSQADRIAKNIKNSTEIVIKDAGHFCWVEQPEQFFKEFENWLKQQGLREQNSNDSIFLSEIKKSSSRQLGAAFKMLETVINNADDSTWTAKINNMPFWQICYHVLWYTDFYFHANQETFQPQDFDIEGIKNYWVKPDPPMIENQKHPISKKNILTYCAYARRKAQQFIESIDSTYFTVPSPFEWHGFPKIDIVDYNLRHLQHHIGQLDIVLRRDQDMGNPWIMFDNLSDAEIPDNNSK